MQQSNKKSAQYLPMHWKASPKFEKNSAIDNDRILR